MDIVGSMFQYQALQHHQDQDVKDQFPEEILTDILSRLPVRSLLRFKCVSKFWETLIDEPDFKMKHLNHSKNNKDSHKFLFYQMRPTEPIYSIYSCTLTSVQNVEDIRELDCPLNIEPRNCTIYCCCDGLAIIRVYENDAERQILLLWNPSTGESIVLPTPKFPVDKSSRLGMCFDSLNGDYKILKIPINVRGYPKVPGEILALKSGCWSKIDDNPSATYNIVHAMHCLEFIHGAFHWIGESTNYFVVSFNISNEVYGEIPLPEQISTRIINIGISVLDGMLCAYSNDCQNGRNTFNLWVMKDYGFKESWGAVFCIADPNICIAAPKYMFKDGEVLFWCFHLECGGSAYGNECGGTTYRTQRGAFTLLPQGILQNGLAFSESLISPRLLTQ